MRPRVAVCVATYRRPEQLRLLIESLAKQKFTRPSPELLLVVVDNDSALSARETVERARATFPWELAYEVAPDRNISVARNQSIAAARRWSCDFIAIIDDDETPGLTWISELLEAQSRFDADAVQGPVQPRFEAGVPGWVRKGGFFDSPRHQTGEAIGYGLTNNVLLRDEFYRERRLAFDPGFGRTGGGDTLFFMSALEAGAKIVWSDTAEVEEFIPAARARTGWILQRAFRVGNAYVRCRRALSPPLKWLPNTIGLAAVRIGAGFLLFIPGMMYGPRGMVTALRLVMHGLGSFAAILGHAHQEYGAVHGS